MKKIINDSVLTFHYSVVWNVSKLIAESNKTDAFSHDNNSWFGNSAHVYRIANQDEYNFYVLVVASQLISSFGKRLVVSE